MSVDAGAFKAWLADLTGGESVSAACRQADLRRATLTQQLIRGRVPETTVVALARAYGQEPLVALNAFAGYHDLLSRLAVPSDTEVLSQVAYRDVLRELLRRSNSEKPPPMREDELEPAPFSGSVRAWIDAIDPGRLRQRLADDLRMAPSNLSTQITSGTLPPLNAVHAARLAETSLASALVVIGLITPVEGGWEADARASVLLQCTDETLVAASITALEGLQRSLARYRKTEATDEYLGW